jgi:hypothetical protein
MGDLVSVRSTKQEAYNNQVGISTRDVGGSVTSGAAGAVTASQGVAGGAGAITAGQVAAGTGSTISISSLDPLALTANAQAIHDALASNVAISQGATEAYQKALTIVSEHSTADTAANTFLGKIGLNANQAIWLGVAIVGGVILYGYLKKR